MSERRVSYGKERRIEAEQRKLPLITIDIDARYCDGEDASRLTLQAIGKHRDALLLRQVVMGVFMPGRGRRVDGAWRRVEGDYEKER